MGGVGGARAAGLVNPVHDDVFNTKKKERRPTGGVTTLSNFSINRPKTCPSRRPPRRCPRSASSRTCQCRGRRSRGRLNVRVCVGEGVEGWSKVLKKKRSAPSKPSPTIFTSLTRHQVHADVDFAVERVQVLVQVEPHHFSCIFWIGTRAAAPVAHVLARALAHGAHGVGRHEGAAKGVLSFAS